MLIIRHYKIIIFIYNRYLINNIILFIMWYIIFDKLYNLLFIILTLLW